MVQKTFAINSPVVAFKLQKSRTTFESLPSSCRFWWFSKVGDAGAANFSRGANLTDIFRYVPMSSDIDILDSKKVESIMECMGRLCDVFRISVTWHFRGRRGFNPWKNSKVMGIIPSRMEH